MRFCILLLCAIFWLFPCRAAQAASLSAVIDGMSITVSEPWTLYTRVCPECPESFTLSYTRVDESGGDIAGQGYAYAYPLRPEERPPAHEALKSMTAGELQALLLALGKGRLHFPEPRGSLELVRRKGHSVILCTEFQQGGEQGAEQEHAFTSYHLLGGHLAVLAASVFGTEDEARLLQAICASFDPTSAEVGSGSGERTARNSLAWDGISLSAPRNWRIRVAPESNGQDPVWAELSIQGEDDQDLAGVLLLRPEDTEALPAAEDVLRSLRYEAFGKTWTTHMNGVPLTPEACRPAGSAHSEIAWRPERPASYLCTDESKHLALEIASFLLGGKILNLVTGWQQPLPAALRDDLAGIYASVSYKDVAGHNENEAGEGDAVFKKIFEAFDKVP